MVMNNLSNIPIFLVKFYQVSLGYFVGGNCRFYPSCSNYAIECYNNYTFTEATVLAAKRICRCHPFSKQHQLYDPVPLKTSRTTFEKMSHQKGSHK
jgi:putative membrane protein insertion efficiency factor